LPTRKTYIHVSVYTECTKMDEEQEQEEESERELPAPELQLGIGRRTGRDLVLVIWD